METATATGSLETREMKNALVRMISIELAKANAMYAVSFRRMATEFILIFAVAWLFHPFVLAFIFVLVRTVITPAWCDFCKRAIELLVSRVSFNIFETQFKELETEFLFKNHHY